MSGFKNFAVIGAGVIGGSIIHQLLTDKAAGTVDDVVVLTRKVSFTSAPLRPDSRTDQVLQGSKTAVDPAAKLIAVDYSDKESIKKALTGVDVVISTITWMALDVQPGIAEAAKEAGVKLFVPSEFGGPTEGTTGGILGEKANFQEQLRAIGIPYSLFYTGLFSDYVWVPSAILFAVLPCRLFNRRAGWWASMSPVAK